jgi:hypothetical protein
MTTENQAQDQNDKEAEVRENITIILTPEMQDKIEALENGALNQHPMIKVMQATVSRISEQDPERSKAIREAWEHAMGKMNEQRTDHQRVVESLIKAAEYAMKKSKESEGVLGDIDGIKRGREEDLLGIIAPVSEPYRAEWDMDNRRS